MAARSRPLALARLATLGLAAIFAARAAARRVRRIDLAGRVVVIAGGMRGRGLLLADELAAAGAKVALVDRDPVAVEATSARLRARGVPVIGEAFDLAVEELTDAFLDRVRDAWGRIDVLVHDAGVVEVSPLDHLTPGRVVDVMAARFSTPLFVTLAALDDLREQAPAARVVDLAAIGGGACPSRLASLAASKFALLGFSAGLRAELARHGVRVVTVVLDDSSADASIDARFARRIVRAIREGRATIGPGLPHDALALLGRVAPAVTTATHALLGRLLPADEGARVPAEGPRRRGRPGSASPKHA